MLEDDEEVLPLVGQGVFYPRRRGGVYVPSDDPKMLKLGESIGKA